MKRLHAASVVTAGDITTNLKTTVGTGDTKEDKNSDVWGTTFNVEGTITSKETLTNVKYRWVDENKVVVKDADGKDLSGSVSFEEGTDKVSGLSLATYDGLAGKKLTLHIYSASGDTTADYDIDTGITVSVEKKALYSVDVAFGSGKDDVKAPVYSGFSQTVDVKGKGVIVTVKDAKDAATGIRVPEGKEYYTLSATSATNAGDKITVTATATPDSPYTGTVTKDIPISRKELDNSDIIANVKKGLSYPYTGKNVSISKDDITVVESKSDNNGDDGKLSGADLSGAFKSAVVDGTSAGDKQVTVTLDKTKLTNFKTAGANEVSVDPTKSTENTVEITKRDLSPKGTSISVNTTSGYIPLNVTANTLYQYLTFVGTEGTVLKLDHNTDYEVTLENGNAIYRDNDAIKDGGVYTATVTARVDGNCENKQSFKVTISSSVLTNVAFENTYKPSYTGETIQPSKKDLGNLKVYVNGNSKPETVKTDSYEITGYTNNTNATEYELDESNQLVIKKTASVNVKITSGTYEGKTVSIPFLIKPLVVEADYVTVPDDVSINKALTEAGEYKLPVTVVAKDETGKKVEKTLTDSDFTVKYEYENKDIANGLFNNIITEVTVTNTNYILKTTNGKTRTVTASGKTEIVPKKLTDAMVVATPSTYTYTGGKIQPTYAVLDGAIALYKKGEVNDKDAEYEEVSISNAVNVGTGTITVQGYNNFYSGKATGTFTITAANTADVKVSIADQDYTGKQVRPRKFTATLNGNDVSNQFEIVSYGENVEAGVGTVVLKPLDGNKNFTGSNITASFNIVKEKVEATLNVYDSKGFDVTDAYTADVDKDADGNVNGVVHNSQTAFTFDGNEHTFAKALLSNIRKVTDDGVKTTAKESDFEIKYADNITGKKVTAGKENIGYIYAVAKEGTGFAGTKTIVTSDGTIINGVVAYIPFTIKSVEFVAKNVSVKNATYAAGLPVKPEVLIQIGGSTLVEGKDYTLRLIDKDGNTVTPIDVTVGDIYGVEIKGINGYTESGVATFDTDDVDSTAYSRANLTWGVDKKNINDCTVTVKDGVTTVLNGYLPVPATEYTSEKNTDGTYTVKANSTSKNYTGSKTVIADGKAEDEKPDAPMISSVKVVGNKATVILSGDSDGAAGYDYVISTDRDCITNKDYDSVNKNQVQTSTTFKYVQQGTYYAYCHAWKRDENGKKVFSDWSNAYPFVVSAITPDAPVITNVKVSGSTIKVTYKAAANATGYDVVLGTGSKKENGETRPYQYGNHKKLNLKEGTVTATFKNVPKGTWVVGMHAFNRTSEDGKKVFSPWSNLKKATVK
ncbi:MAG: hypothetical protein ACLUTA_10075 [Blautia wexlerae]